MWISASKPIAARVDLRYLHNDIHRSRYDRADGEGGEITISVPRLLVCVPLHMKLVQCAPRGRGEVSRELFQTSLVYTESVWEFLVESFVRDRPLKQFSLQEMA